uniref:non-specific serine/threonine protein kinase n=1 Tax=Spermophilus dauricus TaxID=99837 RepID=A0A8C9P1D0_SPEDA
MATIQSETDCYDIIEVLGKGTFGEVAKGWRRSTGEMVAIKILKNDTYRSRIIKNELKLLRCMRGLDPDEAHIIRFLEFFHDALKFYLVFELLEQNLFEFQKENNFAPLPARHIRTVTLQVLRALARLKELAIIHADLKPENIMLVDQTRCPFRVKVIDFGSASIFSEVRYVKEPYIQSRFYRAPEILLGLPFCEKVDVWSLGCVMAELHLGWPLYPGNNEYDQVRYICETQGLPKPHLLHASRKAHHFFKRNPHPDATNPWQLKSSADYLAETKVRPLERRKYMLKSLDQIETVNGGGAASRLTFPDREALAEHAGLKSMGEFPKSQENPTVDFRSLLLPPSIPHLLLLAIVPAPPTPVLSSYQLAPYYLPPAQSSPASQITSQPCAPTPGPLASSPRSLIPSQVVSPASLAPPAALLPQASSQALPQSQYSYAFLHHPPSSSPGNPFLLPQAPQPSLCLPVTSPVCPLASGSWPALGVPSPLSTYRGSLPRALSLCPVLPARVGELHGGQVVHDRDVDETPGVVHHVEQGLQVWGAATWTQGWGCTLGVRGESRQFSCQGYGHSRSCIGTAHHEPGLVDLTEF